LPTGSEGEEGFWTMSEFGRENMGSNAGIFGTKLVVIAGGFG
jgi:hypothetical protein